ncbi:MAG: polymer-forming cytoskeletal protein [Xanthomonadaceae bacterium]|nr:polymer-forming cytoskeletal protein [Xanthomonadaceae bacterium]
MAIFGKNRAQPGPRNGSTIISAGSELIGDLALTDSLHVDGRIEGNIQSQADIAIGEQGHIKGHLKARRVIISGTLTGTISAERLEIIAGGTVEGDVQTVELVIEPGGRFNGSSEILAQKAVDVNDQASPLQLSDKTTPDRKSKPPAAQVASDQPLADTRAAI